VPDHRIASHGALVVDARRAATAGCRGATALGLRASLSHDPALAVLDDSNSSNNNSIISFPPPS
jgi:hypothetical protein